MDQSDVKDVLFRTPPLLDARVESLEIKRDQEEEGNANPDANAPGKLQGLEDSQEKMKVGFTRDINAIHKTMDRYRREQKTAGREFDGKITQAENGAASANMTTTAEINAVSAEVEKVKLDLSKAQDEIRELTTDTSTITRRQAEDYTTIKALKQNAQPHQMKAGAAGSETARRRRQTGANAGGDVLIA